MKVVTLVMVAIFDATQVQSVDIGQFTIGTNGKANHDPSPFAKTDPGRILLGKALITSDPANMRQNIKSPCNEVSERTPTMEYSSKTISGDDDGNMVRGDDGNNDDNDDGPSPEFLLKPGEYDHTIVTDKETEGSETLNNEDLNDNGIGSGDNNDDDSKASDLDVDAVNSQTRLFHLSKTESMLEVRDSDDVVTVGGAVLYNDDFEDTDIANISKDM